MNYYNEFDPFAANWLRSLIKEGLIPNGHVDARDIRDVLPSDLSGYTQCHFFAGIGGWSYALQLAGWPADRPVWTGSCPCQPFSAAGKGAGFADERHLWPSWFHLIRTLRPEIVMGEQVDKALDWLDLVCTDLDGEAYTCGAVIAPAASVGAPHQRHRLWFIANSNESLRYLANPQHPKRRSEHQEFTKAYRRNGSRGSCELGIMEQSAGEQAGVPGFSWLGREADFINCRDGKRRPVEPGTFPLAHGVPKRVGQLRGYGNAIVPQVAAEVIGAYLSCTQD